MSTSAYAWLGSFVAAAIPTVAILLQMGQQSEALRQQVVQIEQQNTIAEKQLAADALDRADAKQAELTQIVSENFSTFHRGTPSEQRQLARLLVQRFGADACETISDWADNSTSTAQWNRIAEGSSPSCSFSPPTGCGRVYLIHPDPSDADALQSLTDTLTADGCVVQRTVRTNRKPGVYGLPEPAAAAAETVNSTLRRRLRVVPSDDDGHIEIVLPDL